MERRLPRYLLPKKRQLDLLAGEIVRSRGRCENDNCLSKAPHTPLFLKQLTWAHIISRRFLNTRWDISNAFCLCWACHQYFTAHPLEWKDFVIAKIGEEAYEVLLRKSQLMTKPDYGQILFKLKETKKYLGL